MNDTSVADTATLHSLSVQFSAGARYSERMDCAIYLTEDCSYRSMRVSEKLSLLVAPYDDRAVGVKIKGVQYLINQLLSILNQNDGESVELQQLLKMAIVSDEYAGKAMTEAEAQRRKQLASRASEFLAGARIQIEIPRKMAA